MTDEEKKAAEQKAAEEAAQAAASVETPDPLKEKDELIEKLKEERDNYKAVALKRLGKLPGDDDFGKNGDGLTVAEQVRLALLDEEITRKQREKDQEIARMAKENSEMRLLLKNRPELKSSIGDGGEGSTVEVKDNVLSEQMRASLADKAKKIGADPEKFIENFRKNLTNNK